MAEVADIPCDEREIVNEGRGCDEGVAEPRLAILAQFDCPVCYRTIHRKNDELLQELSQIRLLLRGQEVVAEHFDDGHRRYAYPAR